MAEFKVLKNNQTYMTHLGIYSKRLTEPTNDFFKSIASYYVLTAMFVAYTASIAFAWKYPSDVKPVLSAVKISFGAIQCAGMFFGIGLKMIRVKALHLELQRIVDKADEDNREVLNIYWECEQMCRKHTRRFSYYVLFHTSTVTIGLVYALSRIALGDYDTSSYYLPFFMVFPFDRSHLRGWFITWFIQFNIAFCYALCMTSITSYFVSCCYYIHAMVDHFDLLNKFIARDVKYMQTEENPQKIPKIREQIITQLGDMVKFHIKIYEIFSVLADIFSTPIFALIPLNAIFLSVSMYDVEMSTKSFDPVLLFDVSILLSALFWPAFICYSASHATDRILLIGNMVYNSNWFEYPPEVRKCVILLIARSQQAVYFNGLGIIHCTLEVFAKLCKTSSSYYIMFRAIGRR